MINYPWTDFNKTNLSWIMKTLKKLEPAAQMVEDSQAALTEAQRVASEAQQTAEVAAAAVESVTDDAAEAIQTANEAMEIAQQAAAATIADGSVSWIKLDSGVQTRITTAGNDATSAITTAENAARTAQNAGNNAAQAQQGAAVATITANQALAKAEEALNQSWADWVRYANIGGSGTSLERSVSTPVCHELLLLFYDLNAPNRRQSMVIPYQAVTLGSNFYEAYITGINVEVFVSQSVIGFESSGTPTGSVVIYTR